MRGCIAFGVRVEAHDASLESSQRLVAKHEPWCARSRALQRAQRVAVFWMIRDRRFKPEHPDARMSPFTRKETAVLFQLLLRSTSPRPVFSLQVQVRCGKPRALRAEHTAHLATRRDSLAISVRAIARLPAICDIQRGRNFLYRKIFHLGKTPAEQVAFAVAGAPITPHSIERFL